MTLDVAKVNALIAAEGELVDLFFRAKLALTNDDFDTFKQAHGQALKKLDEVQDMKSALEL